MAGRTQVLLLGAALAVVVGFVWRAEPPVAPAVAEPDPQAPATLVPAWLGRAEPDAPLPPAGVPLAAGEVEVCGVGRVRPASAEALAHGLERQARGPLLEVFDAMAASADESRRAAGLLLRARLAAHARMDALQATQPACAVGQPCMAALREEGLRASQADRESLARLASSSREATVYALALQACRGAEADAGIGVARGPSATPNLAPAAASACLLLSAEQWARLEPDNGAAWLAVATAAQHRNDTVGFDAAMARFADAATIDLHDGAWFAAVEDGRWRGLAPAAQLMGNAWLVNDAATRALEPYTPAVTWCSRTALADVNRREACARVAATLADHAPTFAGAAVGTAIGTRVGWSPARLASLQEERDALLAVGEAPDPGPHDPGPFSCGAVRQLQVQNGNRARLGERGAARFALQARGQPVAEAAAAYRAARAAQAAAAIANGSANAPAATMVPGTTALAPVGDTP
jgi:hypothetical protein